MTPGWLAALGLVAMCASLLAGAWCTTQEAWGVQAAGWLVVAAVLFLFANLIAFVFWEDE